LADTVSDGRFAAAGQNRPSDLDLAMASALAGSRINHATASTVELVKKNPPQG